VLRIDNLRVSKEPALTSGTNPNVDDFENGIDTWWYAHACTPASVVDSITGSHVLKLTNGGIAQDTQEWSNTNPWAYNRKTMHADWSGYKTLEFDARVANSNTNHGFLVKLRDFIGGYQEHLFTPGQQWKTYRIDISGDVRAEIIGLLFYPNYYNGFAISQNGAQELYIDNIRLTNNPIQSTFATIADLKNVEEGTVVTVDHKICAGQFEATIPDRYNYSTMRNIFFLEEPNRSAAIPVVIGQNVTEPSTNIPEGTMVKVTGLLTSDWGIRYIYATSITIEGSGQSIPKPIGLLNKACGSGNRELDEGVPEFTGLDTTGMLATVWGKVITVGGPDMFGRCWRYIDDGSAVTADNGMTGVKVYDFSGQFVQQSEVGKYARATGFIVNDMAMDPVTGLPTGQVIRSLWLKKEISDSIILDDYR
jgi:hypothetical protein